MFSLDGSHLQMKRKELLWTSATTLQTKPKQEFAFNVLSLDGSHMQMKRIELLWTSAKPKQELAFNVLSLDGSHMQMKRIEPLWTSAKPKQELAFNVLSLDGSHMQMKRIELLWTSAKPKQEFAFNVLFSKWLSHANEKNRTYFWTSTTTLQTKSKQKCVMTTPKKYETKHSVSNHAQDRHSFPVLYRGRPGPKVLS
jgi:predicted RNA binding protein YcfA (HicA-like mRNA interferase family)